MHTAGILAIQLLFTARLRLLSLQKAQQLAQLGIPLAERVLLPHILDITKSLYAGLAWGGAAREVGNRCMQLTTNCPFTAFVDRLLTPASSCLSPQVCMRLLRSQFYNMALGKFLDVQAAFGASGLHAKLVDASLDLLRGPSATSAQVRGACWSGARCMLAVDNPAI